VSWNSEIEVTLKIIIGTDTDSCPGDIPDVSLKEIITDVLADQISQFDDGDLSNSITGWTVIETKKEDM
jgi:hypothetical protein